MRICLCLWNTYRRTDVYIKYKYVGENPIGCIITPIRGALYSYNVEV